LLPERRLHTNTADHQPESTSRTRGSIGRFLWAGDHSRHSVRRPVGNQIEFLKTGLKPLSRTIAAWLDIARRAGRYLDPSWVNLRRAGRGLLGVGHRNDARSLTGVAPRRGDLRSGFLRLFCFTASSVF